MNAPTELKIQTAILHQPNPADEFFYRGIIAIGTGLYRMELALPDPTKGEKHPRAKLHRLANRHNTCGDAAGGEGANQKH